MNIFYSSPTYSSTLAAEQSPVDVSVFSKAMSETTRKMIVPHSTDYWKTSPQADW